MNLKERLSQLGMTQLELLEILRKRGFEISPQSLSSTLSGWYTFPKAKAVLAECEKIIEEIENYEFNT